MKEYVFINEGIEHRIQSSCFLTGHVVPLGPVGDAVLEVLAATPTTRPPAVHRRVSLRIRVYGG